MNAFTRMAIASACLLTGCSGGQNLGPLPDLAVAAWAPYTIQSMFRARPPAGSLIRVSSDAGSDETAAMTKLADESGCLACHAEDRKVIGPSWQDIAKRYENDPQAESLLVDAVKKGSQGKWTAITGGISMPPYYPRVSEEDIRRLVDYILSLKT